MKKLGLFLFFVTSLSLLSFNSCKKEDDDADQFVGNWVNVADNSDIVVITKVNANSILVNGSDQLSVNGSTFTGSNTDDSNGHSITVNGVLSGNVIAVTFIEKDQQGNVVDTSTEQYRKM